MLLLVMLLVGDVMVMVCPRTLRRLTQQTNLTHCIIRPSHTIPSHTIPSHTTPSLWMEVPPGAAAKAMHMHLYECRRGRVEKERG